MSKFHSSMIYENAFRVLLQLVELAVLLVKMLLYRIFHFLSNERIIIKTLKRKFNNFSAKKSFFKVNDDCNAGCFSILQLTVWRARESLLKIRFRSFRKKKRKRKKKPSTNCNVQYIRIRRSARMTKSSKRWSYVKNL